MNRRAFLASTAMLPNALLEAQQQITHVDTVREGAPLKSSVVKGSSLPSEGNSPGAKAKVNFNGPTGQLAARIRRLHAGTRLSATPPSPPS